MHINQKATITKQVETSRGVTIVELLVTLAIFGAVSAVLISSFITLFAIRTQSSATESAYDDMRVVFDTLERELQNAVGSTTPTGPIGCAAPGGSACTGLQFEILSGGERQTIAYRGQGTGIQKAVENLHNSTDPCYGLAIPVPSASVCWQNVTGASVFIEVLDFTLEYPAGESVAQKSPLITIGIKGVAKDDAGNAVPLQYSTSLNPRNEIFVDQVVEIKDPDAPLLFLMEFAALGGSTGGESCNGIHANSSFTSPVTNPVSGGEYYTLCDTLGVKARGQDTTGMLYLQLVKDAGAPIYETPPIGGTVIEHTFNGVGLTAYTRHTITLRAVDIAGNAVAQSFTIVRGSVPDTISNFNAVADPACAVGASGNIRITWDRDPDATNGYTLTRDGILTPVVAQCASCTSFTNNHTVPPNGLQHNYSVYGMNALGNGPVASRSAFAPLPCAPANLTPTPSATCGSKQIAVTWSGVTNANLYELHANGTLIYSGATPSYTHNAATVALPVQDNTSYSYTVRARVLVNSTNVWTAWSSPPMSATAPRACQPKLIICPEVMTVPIGGSDELELRYWNDLASTPNCSTTDYTPITSGANWTSSNDGQATVTNGLVTGVAAGTPTITATYLGTPATRMVTVTSGGPCIGGGTPTHNSGTWCPLASCQEPGDRRPTYGTCPYNSYPLPNTIPAGSGCGWGDSEVQFRGDCTCYVWEEVGCPAAPPTACAPAGSSYRWNGFNWDDYLEPNWFPDFPTYGIAMNNRGSGLTNGQELIGSVTNVFASGVDAMGRPEVISCGGTTPPATCTYPNPSSGLTTVLDDGFSNYHASNCTTYSCCGGVLSTRVGTMCPTADQYDNAALCGPPPACTPVARSYSCDWYNGDPPAATCPGGGRYLEWEFCQGGSCYRYPLANGEIGSSYTQNPIPCQPAGDPYVRAECSCAPECSDGADNDLPIDNRADYPNDPGCESASDNDEGDTGCWSCELNTAAPIEFCGVQPQNWSWAAASANRGDGGWLCRAGDIQDIMGNTISRSEVDMECAPTPLPFRCTCDPAEPCGPPPACTDGLDNDGDGLIDDADCGCTAANALGTTQGDYDESPIGGCTSCTLGNPTMGIPGVLAMEAYGGDCQDYIDYYPVCLAGWTTNTVVNLPSTNLRDGACVTAGQSFPGPEGCTVLGYECDSATTCLDDGEHTVGVYGCNASAGVYYPIVGGTDCCNDAYGRCPASLVSRDPEELPVTCGVATPPTATLTVNPGNTITAGQSIALTWSSTGASSCTAGNNAGSSAWNGSKPTSGISSAITLNTTGTYTFTLQCSNGTVNSPVVSRTVTVNAATIACYHNNCVSRDTETMTCSSDIDVYSASPTCGAFGGCAAYTNFSTPVYVGSAEEVCCSNPTAPVCVNTSTTPTLSTPTSGGITATGATLGATVSSNGGSALTARGTCWGTTNPPSSNCAPEGGTAVSAFIHARVGMTCGTMYYYRGYATNAVGTSYSGVGTFTTGACAAYNPCIGGGSWSQGSGARCPGGGCGLNDTFPTGGQCPGPDPTQTPPNNSVSPGTSCYYGAYSEPEMCGFSTCSFWDWIRCN